MDMQGLRRAYHRRLCQEVLAERNGVPNIADRSSKASIAIARALVQQLDEPLMSQAPDGQRAGMLFEQITRDFLQEAFTLLTHLRPGRWLFSVGQTISDFDQYEHLARIQALLKQYPELATTLGGNYIVKPDIVVGKYPISDDEINLNGKVIGESGSVAELTPFRSYNHEKLRLLLHASISCKWTIRSDRSQNTRTEALNLIRNRKGHT
ncbi:MAG: restriction endonuclease, partial [Chloroflexi bacterium]|nr:restriction endonuclease [Chloroflexota bacterium]